MPVKLQFVVSRASLIFQQNIHMMLAVKEVEINTPYCALGHVYQQQSKKIQKYEKKMTTKTILRCAL